MSTGTLRECEKQSRAEKTRNSPREPCWRRLGRFLLSLLVVRVAVAAAPVGYGQATLTALEAGDSVVAGVGGDAGSRMLRVNERGRTHDPAGCIVRGSLCDGDAAAWYLVGGEADLPFSFSVAKLRTPVKSLRTWISRF